MRKIGQLSTAASAERFHRYLSQRGIENRVDAAGDQWEVWVYEETQVQNSRDELAAFVADSSNSRFNAPAPVKVIPRTPPAPIPARRSSGSPAGAQTLPITILISVMCCWLTFATNFGKREAPLQELQIATSGSVGLDEALQKEPWRLVTPIFLHFSVLHLGMNLYMFWMLGSIIERRDGSFRLLFLVLATAIVSNLLQFYWAGPRFGGLSGVDFGVFGYLWLRSLLLPSDGYFMPRQLVQQVILFGIICILADGYLPVANAAHVGGLVAGAFLGALPRLWREK